MGNPLANQQSGRYVREMSCPCIHGGRWVECPSRHPAMGSTPTAHAPPLVGTMPTHSTTGEAAELLPGREIRPATLPENPGTANMRKASLTAAHTAKSQEAVDDVGLKGQPPAAGFCRRSKWISAANKIKAANRFAAAGEERSTRREEEGAPTGAVSSPRASPRESGWPEGLSSSRPASADATPRHNFLKTSYSLTTATKA